LALEVVAMGADRIEVHDFGSDLGGAASVALVAGCSHLFT